MAQMGGQPQHQQQHQHQHQHQQQHQPIDNPTNSQPNSANTNDRQLAYKNNHQNVTCFIKKLVS